MWASLQNHHMMLTRGAVQVAVARILVGSFCTSLDMQVSILSLAQIAGFQLLIPQLLFCIAWHCPSTGP